MDSIVFNDPEHGDAIALAAGTFFVPKIDISIGRERDGTLLGGVVFNNFTDESIEIHSAAFNDHWVNRDLIFVTFDYPFNQLGVKRLFGRVAEHNLRAIRFNTKLGFKPVARIEGVYRHGIACIVMRMDREDCRFLGVKPRSIKSNLN
ncbi:MAG TPA: GNAT family protein [Pseudoxanthomonas sp.]